MAATVRTWLAKFSARRLRPRRTHQRSAAQRGTWLLGIAAMLFAVMAVCAKAATEHRLAGPEVAFIRFCLGVASGVVPLALGIRLRPQQYAALGLRGLLGGLAVLTYFGAIAHLPVGIATLLNSSSPVFVALFSTVFLREPLGRIALLAMGVTSAGVALVVLGNAPVETSRPTGSLLWALIGLGSAVLSGGAVTTVRSMRHREGSWEIFLSFSLIGAVLTALPTARHWVTPNTTELFWLLGMGVSSVAAQVLMTHALRDVAAVRAGLILQLTPITTYIIGVVFLHERPAALGLLGGAITVAGITWGVLLRGRPPACRHIPAPARQN